MSAPERTIKHVRASKHGDFVRLHGFATWLKGEPMIVAYMRPADARRLAIDLLRSAEQAPS